MKRDIITTQLVNRLVNRMGTIFVMEVSDETGASPAQVAGAWYAATSVLDAEALWRDIESLDLVIDAAAQMALMVDLRAMTGAATRLLLAQHVGGASIGQMVAEYRPSVLECMDRIRGGDGGAQVIRPLIQARAQIIAAFELVNLARACAHPLNEVAGALDSLAAQLDLDWLGAAINRLPAGNRWQARARAQLSAELTALRQQLLQQVLGASLPPTEGASAVFDELKSNVPQDLAMLSAGLAEARRLLAS